MSKDIKTPLFSKVINNIQNHARHRLFLLTQLINPSAKKIIPENCDMLRKMKEGIEEERALHHHKK
jgi:hypothetical protein